MYSNGLNRFNISKQNSDEMDSAMGLENVKKFFIALWVLWLCWSTYYVRFIIIRFMLLPIRPEQ